MALESDQPKLQFLAITSLAKMGAGAEPATDALVAALGNPQLSESAEICLNDIGAAAVPALLIEMAEKGETFYGRFGAKQLEAAE